MKKTLEKWKKRFHNIKPRLLITQLIVTLIYPVAKAAISEYNRLLILLIEKAVDTCEGIMRKNLSIRLWISVFSCLPAFGSFPKILSAIVSGIQEGSCRTAV